MTASFNQTWKTTWAQLVLLHLFSVRILFSYQYSLLSFCFGHFLIHVPISEVHDAPKSEVLSQVSFWIMSQCYSYVCCRILCLYLSLYYSIRFLVCMNHWERTSHAFINGFHHCVMTSLVRFLLERFTNHFYSCMTTNTYSYCGGQFFGMICDMCWTSIFQ